MLHYRSKTHFWHSNYAFQQKYINLSIRNVVEAIKLSFCHSLITNILKIFFHHHASDCCKRSKWVAYNIHDDCSFYVPSSFDFFSLCLF